MGTVRFRGALDDKEPGDEADLVIDRFTAPPGSLPDFGTGPRSS
ncbi:MAG: hypothetical protein Ct9H300mP12_07710 [Acidimicrobiales bacterium]|nr:MAG: hypothetical protein Ct9H300mP12_07710 [Acidimicrobiales bacterium]